MSTQTPFAPSNHDAQRGHRPPDIRLSSHATSHPAIPSESDKITRVELRVLAAKRRLRLARDEFDKAAGVEELQDGMKWLKRELRQAEWNLTDARLERKIVRFEARIEKERSEKGLPVSEQEAQVVVTSQNDRSAPQERDESPSHEMPVSRGVLHGHTHQPPLSVITKVTENVSENDTATTGTITTVASRCTRSEHGKSSRESTSVSLSHEEQLYQPQILAPSPIVVSHHVSAPDSKPSVPVPSFVHVLSASPPLHLSPIVLTERNPLPGTYGCGSPQCYSGHLRAISSRPHHGALPRTPARRKPPWYCYRSLPHHSLCHPLCVTLTRLIIGG
ncbi:hypothetical protein V5O48_016779 [Marasmius crinis-equi]|uniref:Uncharacterized protein n=1 Tax=Marasmius crinis-equi TaxID=585013 RepID=A0ABR3EQT6_9AGAR